MIAALLLLNSNISHDVVYCARTYKQGKAKSHYSMYLCRHDGTGKKQISRPNEIVTAATWIDDHTIGYLRLKEPYGEFVHIENYHGTICSLDLKTGRRRELKEITMKWPASQSFHRRSVLSLDFSDFTLSRVGVVAKKQALEFSDRPGKELPQNQEFSEFAELKTADGKVRIDWQCHYEDDPLSKFRVKFTLPNGKIVNEKFLGDTVEVLFVQGNQIFLVARRVARIHDRTRFIHQIDLDSGKSKVIISGVGDNTFSPKNRIWLANDNNNYNLELLDDGRAVHVDHLYAGNWKTGQRWTITGKLTDVVSASLK